MVTIMGHVDHGKVCQLPCTRVQATAMRVQIVPHNHDPYFQKCSRPVC